MFGLFKTLRERRGLKKLAERNAIRTRREAQLQAARDLAGRLDLQKTEIRTGAPKPVIPPVITKPAHQPVSFPTTVAKPKSAVSDAQLRQQRDDEDRRRREREREQERRRREDDEAAARRRRDDDDSLLSTIATVAIIDSFTSSSDSSPSYDSSPSSDFSGGGGDFGGGGSSGDW